MKNLKIFSSKKVINRVLEEVRKDWPEAFIYDFSDGQQAILLQQESNVDYDQDKDLFLSEDHTAIERYKLLINGE